MHSIGRWSRSAILAMWLLWVSLFVILSGTVIAVYVHHAGARLAEYRRGGIPASPPQHRILPIVEGTFFIAHLNRYTVAASTAVVCIPPAIVTALWAVRRRKMPGEAR